MLANKQDYQRADGTQGAIENIYVNNMRDATSYRFSINKYFELMVEPEIIVMALDESGSMSGKPWTNVVSGAQQMIKHVKYAHRSP